jgi:hypothetical protein
LTSLLNLQTPARTRLPDDEVNKKAVQALSIRYESGKPVIIADFRTMATVMQLCVAKACAQDGSLAQRHSFFRADPGKRWRKPLFFAGADFFCIYLYFFNSN